MSFALSKILWGLLTPSSLIVFLLLGGLILESSARRIRRILGQMFSALGILCIVTIATLPVGQWALTPLENRYREWSPENVDGIIVLGGDEQTDISAARGQPTALDSMRRFVRFSELAKQYPNAKLLYSGGCGQLFPFSKKHPVSDAPDPTAQKDLMLPAEVAREILLSIGAPMDRVLFEKNSRNTYENALYSNYLMRPASTEKWMLVTSAWHMPRAIATFRKAGWNVVAAPTGYFTTGRYDIYLTFHFEEQLRALTYAAHEYVGLISYWLMGRTGEIWPSIL